MSQPLDLDAYEEMLDTIPDYETRQEITGQIRWVVHDLRETQANMHGSYSSTIDRLRAAHRKLGALILATDSAMRQGKLF